MIYREANVVGVTSSKPIISNQSLNLCDLYLLCRFGYKGKKQVKLKTNVTFARKLDLTPFLTSSLQNTSYSSYRLYAVVVSEHKDLHHQHETCSVCLCENHSEHFAQKYWFKT